MSGVLPAAISSATAALRNGGDLGLGQAEIGEAQDFALAHRDAAENLREIFAKADARQQRLDLAEATLRDRGAPHRPLISRIAST